MNDKTTETPGNSFTGIQSWLRSTVTLVLPGWAFAAGALALLVVAAIALD
jgi:hypothetical protein